MLTYLEDLENLPYVSQIMQFNSSFSINNNALRELKDQTEVQNKIQQQRDEVEQSYALRLKIFLQ